MSVDIVQEFKIAMQAAGLIPPKKIISDGKFHRCAVEGHQGKSDGTYRLYIDGLAFGGFQNWTDGSDWQTWHEGVDRSMTPEEDNEIKKKLELQSKQHDAEEKKIRANAQKRAINIWNSARACKNHGYLTKKGIHPPSVRIGSDGRLILPVLDEKGVLHSIQYIDAKGNKRFLIGGRVRGCFCPIGELGKTIYITEGLATGASVHEAMGAGVIVGYNSGNLQVVAKVIREEHPNADIVICGDDDKWNPNNPGRKAAKAAALAIGGLAVFPEFGPDRVEGQTDFNDLHAMQGIQAVKRDIERALADDCSVVMKSLHRGNKGKLLAVPANLTKILRLHPRFRDHLGLNEMSLEVCYDREPKPDHYVDEVQEWIQDHFLLDFKRNEIKAKLLAQASRNPFHPVREYLKGLQVWDGVGRLKQICKKVLLTEDSVLYTTYLTKWFIGAVRRVIHPGCKMDTILVLVGPQATLKSSFFDVLGSEFFNDSAIDMTNKDGYMVMHRAWISELGEIDHATSNTAVERMKAFISSRKDIFRAPYAASAVVHPRTCVLAGTTNRDEFLTDTTGSRRFWAIKVTTQADLKLLKKWRDQLWAEAVVLEAAGVDHWLGTDEEAAREVDSERFECVDPWESMFLEWLEITKEHSYGGELFNEGYDTSAGISISQLMERMDIPKLQQNKIASMRLAAILKKHGWEQGRRGSGRARLWSPKPVRRMRVKK